MSTNRKVNLALLMAATVLLAVLAGSPALAGSKPKPPPPPPSPMTNPALVYRHVTNDAYDGLTISTADGSQRQQLLAAATGTPDYSPVWSPDGTRVAFIRATSSDRLLYVVNADGTGLRLVTPLGSDASARDGLDWSPDGSMILCCHGIAGSGGARTGSDMTVVSVQTGASAAFPNLMPNPDPNDPYYAGYPGNYQGTPSFGPDLDPSTPGFQGLVAFQALYWEWEGDSGSPTDPWWHYADIGVVLVHIYEDQGGVHIDLLGEPAYAGLDQTWFRTVSPDLAAECTVFSPDGRSIAFLWDSWCAQADDLKVIAVSAGDSGQISFGEAQPVYTGGQSIAGGPILGRPAWSPNGAWIAFSAYSGSSGGRGRIHYYDVYRIRPDGSGIAAVTARGDTESAYSPDWNPAWVKDLP